MARKFDPLHKRWVSLAKELRKAKDDIDFGRVNPGLSAEDQREKNEVAQQVDYVIEDMRAVASELTGSFDDYVTEQSNGNLLGAVDDEETRLAVLRVLVEKGKMDPTFLEEIEGKEDIVEPSEDMDNESDPETAESSVR